MNFPSNDIDYIELKRKIKAVLSDTRLTDFAKINAIAAIVLDNSE